MSPGMDVSERLSSLYTCLCPEVATVYCLKRIVKFPWLFGTVFQRGGISFCMSAGVWKATFLLILSENQHNPKVLTL